MLVEALKRQPSISIIGMEKNTGKTTLLNSMIMSYGSDKVLALTSIGYDGEDVDQVTSTHKPRIFIPKGTLVATAQSLLKKCDCIKEIIKVLDMRTPIGDVVLFRAKSEGYVELGGPSMIEDLKRLKSVIKRLAPSAQFIVDGALSRQSMAGHHLSDASILCTGAALSGTMASVVEKTSFTIKKLSVPLCDLDILAAVEDADKTAKALIVTSKGEVSVWNETLKPSEDIKAIVLNGLVTTKRLNKLMQYDTLRQITLICEDGTRIFADMRTLNILEKRQIALRVLHPINLLAVGLNAKAPSGNNFNPDDFRMAMQRVTDLPLIDTRSLDELK